MALTYVTIYAITPKYLTALRKMAQHEITHYEGLNRPQLLLDIAIEIMRKYSPDAELNDVITFIEETSHLPKPVAELRFLSERKLVNNLTRLKKIKGWD